MKFKNLLLFFLIIVINISCSKDDVIIEKKKEIEIEMPTDDGVMRNLTSLQLVADMKPGWNLGNALDTESTNETLWGNPVTSKAMIDAVKARGFGTLRVPVTWRFRMGASPDYKIQESWLARVQEVVDYGRANDMYVIINIHHDDEWIIPTYAEADEVKNRLNKVWTQIANHFKAYGDYVIFEVLNEPRHEGTPEEWTGTVEGRDVVNQYSKTCLDAIRATGGNNTTRHIMVASYAAGTVSMNDLVIPNNDERVIVSIHSYFPFEFSLGSNDSTWGTDEDKAQMDANFDSIHDLFVANGVPVIMGEWGTTNRSNTADRLAHAKYYADGCVQRNILPVWWDNGDDSGSAVFNRRGLSWYFPAIADAVINSKN